MSVEDEGGELSSVGTVWSSASPPATTSFAALVVSAGSHRSCSSTKQIERPSFSLSR